MVGDHPRDQSVGEVRRTALGGDEVDEELPGPGGGVEDAGAVAQVEARGAVLPELLPVHAGHPEEVADDPEGDGEPEALDQVDLRPVGGHVVEGVGHDAVDVGLQVGQPTTGEVGRQHPPQPLVVGGVGHAETPDPLGRSPVLAPDHMAYVVGERVGVGEHRPRDVVPRDQPDAGAEQPRQAYDVAARAALLEPGHGVDTVALQGEPEAAGHAASRGRDRQLEDRATHRGSHVHQ